MNTKQLFNEMERTARLMSRETVKPWYVCHKDGYYAKVLSGENLKRYMRLGYSVSCAYFKGKRYKNIYTIGGELQFVV